MASAIFVAAFDCPKLHLILVSADAADDARSRHKRCLYFRLAWFGVLTGERYQEYPWRFSNAGGRAARELVKQHDFTHYKARTLLPLDQVSIWTQPLSYAIECAVNVLRAAVKHGDSPLPVLHCVIKS